MKLELEPYQKVGAAWLASRRAGILADDPGLGKTPQSLTACSLLNATKVIIVCPAALRYQWRHEIYKWYPDIGHQTCIVADGTQEIVGNMPIVSYNMLLKPYIREQLVNMDADVMDCDEGHYLKTGDAQRTQCVLGAKVTRSLIHSVKHKWFLTATPLTGKPGNLYPILTTIAHKKLHPFTVWPAFAKRYCGGFYNSFGELCAYGATNCEELGERLGSVMLRREYKVQKGGGHPEPLVQIVHMESTPAHRGHYEKVKDLWKNSEHKESLIDHEMASYKLPLVMEYIKHMATKVDSLVVGFYHHQYADALKNSNIFKHTYMVNGTVPIGPKRDAVVAAFKKTGGLFAGQIDCCKEGLNGLETNCRDIVFAEIPYTPDAIKQYIGRLRRGKDKRLVRVKIIVCDHTIDANRMKRIGRYTRNINSVMKGAQVC